MPSNLPKTYRTAVYNEPNKGLVFEDRELKLPEDGHILVKVLACGVCHSDSVVGFGGFGNSFPIVPGHEVIGDVAAVPASEKRWKEGDRVGAAWHGGHDNTCKACRTGRHQMCENEQINGVTRDGGYAQYVILRTESVVSIPKDVDPVQFAAQLCAGVTVFNSLRQQKIPPGETVAVQGLGGLGHLALQFASKSGYRTVAISSSDAKKDFATKLGAHDYIDGSKGDIGKQLQDIGGASCILLTAPNSKLIPQLLGGLGIGGKLVVLAATEGPTSLDTNSMIQKGLSVSAWPSGQMQDSEDTIVFARVHNVECMTEVFPLEKASEALKKMEEGKMRFRGVLTPNS